jgi:hypothetical protein
VIFEIWIVWEQWKDAMQDGSAHHISAHTVLYCKSGKTPWIAENDLGYEPTSNSNFNICSEQQPK